MTAEEAGPSDRARLSTPAKLLIGCCGLAVAALMVTGAAVGVGGVFLKRGVDAALGSAEAHDVAATLLARLERDHPFEIPASGVVSEARALDYLTATERAWEGMREWAEDLTDLRRRSDGAAEAEPGLRDVVRGVQGMAGMVRARVVLAEALVDQEMSLDEYAWTGLTLARAVELGRTDGQGVRAENRALAARLGDRLPRFDDGGDLGRGSVLLVATLWGASASSTWSALGLESLIDP